MFIIINKLRKRRVKAPAPRPVPTAEEENKVTGIDALMAQDLGPDATAEDSEALLNPEREIVIEELTEEDSAETPASDEQPSEPTENDGTKEN